MKKKNKNMIPSSGINPKKAEMVKDFTVLLENKFILTKKMNRFYAQKTFYLFHSKWRLTTFAISLLFLTVSIICFQIPNFLIVAILSLIFALYCLFMTFFGYLYSSAVSYHNLVDFYGEPIEMHVVFYPRFFRICTDKGNLDFLYCNISKRIETAEMSILIVGTDNHIEHGQIIDKRTFEPADLAKYYDILENAGVQI